MQLILAGLNIKSVLHLRTFLYLYKAHFIVSETGALLVIFRRISKRNLLSIKKIKLIIKNSFISCTQLLLLYVVYSQYLSNSTHWSKKQCFLLYHCNSPDCTKSKWKLGRSLKTSYSLKLSKNLVVYRQHLPR